MTASGPCCGRAEAAQCRCYTDAEAVAAAVRAFVRSRVRHRQDAEDITQDALYRLYRAAPRLHDELALEAWMYRIARSAIVDHHRRAAVRPQPVDLDPDRDPDLDRDPGPGVGLDGSGSAASLAGCLPVLLARLPTHYRRALELTDLGGLTQERAAAELGLSTSGAKSRVQRGRRLLREEIAHCCRVAVDSRGALVDAEPRSADGRC